MALRRRKSRPATASSDQSVALATASASAAAAAGDDQGPPRLTVELVPSTCWFANVRSAVSKDEWDLIRRRVYREASYRCGVCGGRGPEHPVECHEIWDYDDDRLVQRLAGMIALCPACHEVKHFGFARVRGIDGRAFEHLAAVNGWTAPATQLYLDHVFELWAWRSKHEWDLDLTVLADYGIAPPPDHDGYVFPAERVAPGLTIGPLTEMEIDQALSSAETRWS
jgi:hypothetical protein